MARKTQGDPVRDYLAAIGRKGGQAKVPKGFSTLSEEDRKVIARKAAEARWGVKKKAAGKKKAGK
jgi:hypothetical protein